MSFAVFELPKAKADKRAIVLWLHERSPQGAIAWLDAYDARLAGLRENALVNARAPEDPHCELEVRQALFRTRHGRVYRILYTVEGTNVFVLRVRGPGQAPIQPEDLPEH